MPGLTTFRRCDQTGRFVAPGWPILGVPPSFGGYMPTAAVITGAIATGTNTGLTGPGNLLADKPTPSGGLTPDNATTTLTISSPTTIENVNFKFRDIYIKSAGVTLRNCMSGGGSSTSNTGIINCTQMPVGGDAKIIDHAFVKTNPSIWYTGILGHDYTAIRCYVTDTVDAFGVYNTATPNGPVYVNIYGCYADVLAYISPDPNHPNDKPVSHTHNDFCQIQGGSIIKIVGNVARAMASTNPAISSTTTSPYAPAVSGSCIAITQGVGPVSDVLVDTNWFLGASQQLTLIASKGNQATLLKWKNNIHDLRSSPSISKTNDVDSTARVRGFLAEPTAQFLDTSGNLIWTPATGQKSLLDTVNGNVQINSDGSTSPLVVYRFVDG